MLRIGGTLPKMPAGRRAGPACAGARRRLCRCGHLHRTSHRIDHLTSQQSTASADNGSVKWFTASRLKTQERHEHFVRANARGPARCKINPRGTLRGDELRRGAVGESFSPARELSRVEWPSDQAECCSGAGLGSEAPRGIDPGASARRRREEVICSAACTWSTLDRRESDHCG